MASDPARESALSSFKAKLIESREWEAKLKALRLEIKGLQKAFDQTEDNIKALQSVGQIIGEVLKQLDEERCAFAYQTLNFFLARADRTCLQLLLKHHLDQDMSLAAGPRSTRRS
jgi:26S proteasome regulatory subunit T4